MDIFVGSRGNEGDDVEARPGLRLPGQHCLEITCRTSASNVDWMPQFAVGALLALFLPGLCLPSAVPFAATVSYS